MNVFVYGSLRDPAIFKSVSGLSFTINPSHVNRENLMAEPAVLPYYRRISPDNVYFYAIADLYSRIEGFVIYDVPPSAMKEIDRYEGKRYDRDTVEVNTAKGIVKAQAYLASHESMKKRFGDRFHVNLIHELWLRKRIEEFFKKRIRPGDQTLDADLERRANRELFAITERDLVITHYRTEGISDYYIEHEFDRPQPTIKNLYSDAEAMPFIDNYLAIVIRQVLLNQLDEKIQSRFRFELEHMRTSERYFKRSVSLLMALYIINANKSTVNLIIQKALKTTPHEKNDLINYVKYAVHAADSIFDARIAHAVLDRIRTNFDPGLVPLGAELEFSNLGKDAVNAFRGNSAPKDHVYNGFKYFNDFGLNILTWKLGGYIDDHTDSENMARRSGFLELAPGRLNIVGELSRPVTATPWLLSQLIHEIVCFYDVKPHSLHLSFQLRKNQVGKQKILPLDFVQCLLTLGGGLEQKDTGGLWITRLCRNEITRNVDGEELVFARTSKRRWYLGEDEVADKVPAQAMTHIQQYKFIRLEEYANYEPLILCLKGLQLSYNPADYLTVEQLNGSPELQEQYKELKRWAAEPSEISRETIGRFIAAIQDGLLHEAHRHPVHKLHHIDWALSAIDTQLQLFNTRVKEQHHNTI